METYDNFLVLDLSLRGQLPDGAYIQIIGTFNPSRPFWVKEHFFDKTDPRNAKFDPEFCKNCLCVHTTAYCNEWLPSSFLNLLESQSSVYSLTNLYGEWSDVSGTPILPHWEVWHPNDESYIFDDIFQLHPDLDVICGLDFGYKDPAAFVCVAISPHSRKVWVTSEKTFNPLLLLVDSYYISI